MSGVQLWVARTYWAATFAALAAAAAVAIRAPIGTAMGPIEKLFYLHLPVAMNTFLCGMVVFIACVAYLGGRRQVWDDLAHSAARVTVLNGTVLLLTGVFWARVSWGEWWVWSPRLAFSLLLWLLYVAYLSLRSMFRSRQRSAVIAAIYGIVAFLNVPLFYLCANMLPDVHSVRMDMTPDMERALLLWLVAITLLSGGLIASRFSLTRMISRGADTEAFGPVGSQGRAA